MHPHVLEYDDPEALACAAAERFVQAAHSAIATRRAFRVALSGGSTPRLLYRCLLARYRESLDWGSVHVFWSDERFVAADHDASNEGLARSELLRHVPIPEEQIHGMARGGTPEEAAARYEALLADAPLDLVLLGMGADGHTASLFPGEAAIHETSRRVVASRAPTGVRERITLTRRALWEARDTMMLVSGTEKAPALHEVLDGRDDLDRWPAQCVRDTALWLVTRDALERAGTG